MDKKQLINVLNYIDINMKNLVNRLGSEINIDNVKGALERLIPGIEKSSIYPAFLDKICTKYGIYDLITDHLSDGLYDYFAKAIDNGLMRSYNKKSSIEDFDNFCDAIAKEYLTGKLNLNRMRNIATHYGFVFNFKNINDLIKYIKTTTFIEPFF